MTSLVDTPIAPTDTTSRVSSSPIVIFLEANIGSGKTTFLTQIERNSLFKDVIQVIPEPIEEWLSMGREKTGKSVFEWYYENPHKYAFPFQWMVFHSYVRNLRKAIAEHQQKRIIIVERSVWSIRNVFIESMIRRGIMDQVHQVAFDEWMPFLTNEVYSELGDLNRFIYLDCDVDTCIYRIRSRARTGESSIDTVLLSSLHECHVNWLKLDANPIEGSTSRLTSLDGSLASSPDSDSTDIIRTNGLMRSMSGAVPDVLSLDHTIDIHDAPERYQREVINKFDRYIAALIL